ncbi:MAG TPA: TadE family protein [Stellaceae bacterium]|nr:TadE family protein [Stellaceae bacterium]
MSAVAKGRSTPRRLRAKRGATAAEFAAILPAFIAITLGIMEFGRLMWTKSALNYAVEEAARCAAINTSTCGTQSQVQSFAASHSGQTFAASVFALSTPACGTQVSASYPFQFIVPLVNFSVTLQASYCYPS